MNEKLSLQDLVTLLAQKAQITQKDADKFYRELFQIILEAVYANDQVKIKDFGTFKIVQVSSRESVDVNTGEKIEILAHAKMSFVPDKVLRNLVNVPFAQFESVVIGEDFNSEGATSSEGEDNLDDDDQEEILELEDETLEILPEVDSLEKDKPLAKNEVEAAIIKTVSYLQDIKKTGADSSSDKQEQDLSSSNISRIESKVTDSIESENILESEDGVEIPPLKNSGTAIENKKSSFVTNIANDEKENKIILSDDKEENSNNDFEYSYASYENRNFWDKIKSKLPVILFVLAILLVVGYLVFRLFDVTYDYEYYIQQPKILSVSDTLPLINEPIVDVLALDPSGNKSVNVKDTIFENDSAHYKQVRTPVSLNLSGDRQKDSLQKENPPTFDSIFVSNEKHSSLPKKSFQISDKLRIKILNKAQVYRTTFGVKSVIDTSVLIQKN